MTGTWMEAALWSASGMAGFSLFAALMLCVKTGYARYRGFAWACAWFLLYNVVALLDYRIGGDPAGALLRARMILIPCAGFTVWDFLGAFDERPLRGWRPWLVGATVAFGLLAGYNPGAFAWSAEGVPTTGLGALLAARLAVLAGTGAGAWWFLRRADRRRARVFAGGAVLFLAGAVWDDVSVMTAWRGAGAGAFFFLGVLAAMTHVVVMRQATLRRQTEEHDARLRSVLEGLTDLVAVADPHGRRLERLGVEGPGAGRAMEEAFPGPVAEQVRAAVLRTTLTGAGQSLEFPVDGPDGERWFEGRTVLIRGGAGGTRLDGVAWTSWEVTAARRLEQETRINQEKYSRLFHDSPDALFVTDEDGLLLDANERAETLFAMDRQTLCGGLKAADLMAALSPADGAAEAREIQRHDSFHGERLFRRPAGETFPGDWVVTRVRLGDRTVRLAAVRDITERRREESRMEQAARLEAAGRFAGVMAHDFNNLLAGISGCVELLRERAKPGSEIAVCLDVMKRAADRGAALTRQLLGFARQGMGGAVRVDAVAVAREMMELLRFSLPDGVRLETEIPDGRFEFMGDAAECRQMLLNLAVNAKDAMPNGGVVKLSCGSARFGEEDWRTHRECPGPRDYVFFRVSDTGAGIPDEVRARLFEPFFSTKEGGVATGMGLAMIYGAVKGRGGFVEVDSAAGRGSRFTLYFPAVEPGPSTTPA